MAKSKLQLIMEFFEEHLKKYPGKMIPTTETAASLDSIDYCSPAIQRRLKRDWLLNQARKWSRKFGILPEQEGGRMIRRLIHAPAPLSGKASGADQGYLDLAKASEDQVTHYVNVKVRGANHDLAEIALGIAVLDLNFGKKYTPPFRIPKKIMDQGYDEARKILGI